MRLQSCAKESILCPSRPVHVGGTEVLSPEGQEWVAQACDALEQEQGDIEERLVLLGASSTGLAKV